MQKMYTDICVAICLFHTVTNSASSFFIDLLHFKQKLFPTYPYIMDLVWTGGLRNLIIQCMKSSIMFRAR